MDSQSLMQARSRGNTLPSRATRILQKMTGRIRLYPSRKPVPTAKDDNDPYPSQAAFRSSVAGVKPYMSHPMLDGTLGKPYEPGYEQDSPTQSASPSGSLFRGSIDQHRRGETNIPATTFATIATVAATAPQVIDELPLSLSLDEPLMWNNNNHHQPWVRSTPPNRPPPEPPTFDHHHLSLSESDAMGQTTLSSANTAGQSTSTAPISSHPMTSLKQIKNETPSTFSPARLFTRKASRPNLHGLASKKSTDNLRNAPSRPLAPSNYHRPSPPVAISGGPELPADALPPSPPSPKRPKPAKIDTSLRLFSRKPSRPQLRESHPDRIAEDPQTPYTNGQHGSNRPPSPPPPLPKAFATRSRLPTLAPLPSSSSSTASTSSYHTTVSGSTPTLTTTNTTPASTTMSKPSSSPLTRVPPRIITTASTSAIPTSPPPPILQRSETAPHSYRLSLRLSGTFLRPPPLPLFNLPMLPPPSPSISSPQRFHLRDVPQLRHDGGRRDPDEEDDLDEDEEGRMSRSSGQATPFLGHEGEDRDGKGYRPSFNGSTVSITTTTSLNPSLGREGKTHSRSSSYNHSTLSHSISHDTDTDVSTSFTHGTSTSFSSDFSLPEPDTSRFDLSFLDPEPSPPPIQILVPKSWKGKARARPEDDDLEHGEEGGKTPTIGGYFDVSKSAKYALPVRKDSLKLRMGPDVLCGGVGAGKGKGKEKEWDEEMDTARPQRPGVLQASISLGGPVLGANGGIGTGLGLELSGSGMYASKRASVSLVDLGAAGRRGKVEEIVRDEEEKRMERRKSRRIEGSSAGEVVVKAPKLKIDTQLVASQGGQRWKKGGEDGEREETLRGGWAKGASEATIQTFNSNGEATSSGMATPKQPSSKRLSRAPPYEAAIRRRRSLPMFTEATDPPPYPAFPPLSPSNLHNITPFGLHNHNSSQANPMIEPSDDEGRERLPPYSNALYMRAILPRKMEFISAGIQARDRKWRRVVCVLEGTALKVYKPPRERGGKGVIGEWWERKVGVGDASTSAGPAARPKKDDVAGGKTTTREQIPKLYGEGTDPAGQTELELRPPPTPITPITPERTQPRLTGEHPFVPGQPQTSSSIYGNAQPQANRSRLNLAVSSLLKPSSHSRARSHSRANSNGVNSYLELNVHGNGNSSSSNASGSAGSGHASTRKETPPGHSHISSLVSSLHSRTSSGPPAHVVDDPRDLLRVYTMQNAESGLGNDYVKRKNVIRVRAEGEQFLLQAKDVADVVAWIEVLQASANIALDLDERLMPKGPLFPRRRRRRNRHATTGAGAGTSTGVGTSTPAATSTVTANIIASATAQIATTAKEVLVKETEWRTQLRRSIWTRSSTDSLKVSWHTTLERATSGARHGRWWRLSGVQDAVEDGKIVRGNRPGKPVQLQEYEIKYLCTKAREIFINQPILLELEAPIKICGDIHGQYYDLLRLFEYGGFPPEANYLFLGDYVDRGKQSLETICLLLAYKIKYPENFFILRGNHECASINRIYGFYDECKRRYNIKLWKTFTDCFNCLPIAAIIDEKIFTMHGGLSPDLQSMEQIRRVMRPTDVPDTGLLCDLLWSDPDKDITGWSENDRGVSFTFGPDVVSRFLQKHDMDLICRAHQVVEDGYEFFAKRHLVTLFSAPNYCGEFDNAGAMMSVDETLLCSFQILKPAEKKAKYPYGGMNVGRPVTPPRKQKKKV
ncbi:hypothetical protein C0995_010350 [Termitomyces sp. Mi166|nr:hypothetical protein C0995_010350 [Termitomyces sp. Mi166\